MDFNSAWSSCLEYIKRNVTSSTFETWFYPLKPVSLVDNMLTLEVPSRFFIETLEGQYLGVLSGALRMVLGDGAKLEYTLKIATQNLTQPGNIRGINNNISGGFQPMGKEPVGSEPHNPFAAVAIRSLNIDPQLNASFTFDNFVEGECNKMAWVVGHAVSEKPGNVFNPFFVYGNSGYGKTHLIQAIGAEVKRKTPSSNVIYLSANRFMRQYMDASRNNNINGFLNFYQMIDVLIIDDIQELAGKTGTENIFFQIFNHLQHNKKQIVIAADKKPSEITGFEERLLSRFKSGMIAELTMPDFETRVRIIENKQKQDGITLSQEVINYLATNITTSVRELEGAMVSLLAHATLNHEDLTMDVARRVVGYMVKREEREITIDSISQVVCEYYGITHDTLCMKSRKREIVTARQLAMYLSKELTSSSLSLIGTKFGKYNHSTVLYAAKNVVEQREVDKEFDNIVKELENRIRQ